MHGQFGLISIQLKSDQSLFFIYDLRTEEQL